MFLVTPKFLLSSLMICLLAGLSAQTDVGLVAHYAFDGNLNDKTGSTANTGAPGGTPTFNCGIVGDALELDGASDEVRILGVNNVNREFDTEDFTISFYFKPVSTNGIQYLVSKRNISCNDTGVFYIRYVPATRTLNAFLGQDAAKRVNLITTINNTACWQHVTLVRDDRRVRLYVNTEFATDLGSASRVDISSPGDLVIGGSDCRATNETTFGGLIDDVRIYNRALREPEIRSLFFFPDQILTPDTLIFLGNAVDIDLGPSCGANFNWSPPQDVNSPIEDEPTITPTASGDFIYNLAISDAVSACVATDSIRIRVIDPATLDCDSLYLPRAFTPNDDGLNDTYGISNPYAVQNLISFEILDRWGGRVFYTEDPFARWDGTFQGTLLNPGVLLYRVRYECNGVTRLAAGNVTVVR
jgi:gliding motility-associated-like protein